MNLKNIFIFLILCQSAFASEACLVFPNRSVNSKAYLAYKEKLNNNIIRAVVREYGYEDKFEIYKRQRDIANRNLFKGYVPESTVVYDEEANIFCDDKWSLGDLYLQEIYLSNNGTKFYQVMESDIFGIKETDFCVYTDDTDQIAKINKTEKKDRTIREVTIKRTTIARKKKDCFKLRTFKTDYDYNIKYKWSNKTIRENSNSYDLERIIPFDDI